MMTKKKFQSLVWLPLIELDFFVSQQPLELQKSYIPIFGVAFQALFNGQVKDNFWRQNSNICFEFMYVCGRGILGGKIQMFEVEKIFWQKV